MKCAQNLLFRTILWDRLLDRLLCQENKHKQRSMHTFVENLSVYGDLFLINFNYSLFVCFVFHQVMWYNYLKYYIIFFCAMRTCYAYYLMCHTFLTVQTKYNWCIILSFKIVAYKLNKFPYFLFVLNVLLE